jgi:cysteine desulfurase/selenocysteine lyase
MKEFYPALNYKRDGKQLIYFDNACSVLKPVPVIDAVNHYNTTLGCCGGGRSSHQLSRLVVEMCDEARSTVREFINAESAHEIIWTKNATEGASIIANSLMLEKGDEIILSSMEHHSLLLPFLKLQDQGIIIKVIDLIIEDNEYQTAFSNAITDRTRFAVISCCSNVTGETPDIKAINYIAHSKNIRVLCDACQYIVHNEFDVKKLDVDYAVFSSPKLGGPPGLGILYVKTEFLSQLKPLLLGGGTVHDVLYKDGKLLPDFLKAPDLFEAGLQNYSAIIGFKKALDFYYEKQIYNIFEDSAPFYSQVRDMISSLGLRILGSSQQLSSITSFVLPDNVSHRDFDLFSDDDERFIFAYRSGNHCASPLHYLYGLDPSRGKSSIRVSFYIYNDMEEFKIFYNKLKNFLSVIGYNG